MKDSLARLPYKNLFTFGVVAQLCSFKQAAEQLCITPQAVSIQMRALETALAVQLFERYSAGIALTAAGRQLYDYVERSQQLLEQGIAAARVCQQRRQFRVNASPWFAVHQLLPLIDQFAATYPEVDIRVTASARFPDFQAQQLDCAIQWGWGQWPSSAKQLLLRDDKYLVCAPSVISAQRALNTPADLRHHRLLCTELSVVLWQQLANTLGLDLLVEQQVLILDSQASQVEATERGLGVALLSDRVAVPACEAGRLIKPLWQEPISELNPALLPGYWLVMSEDSQQDALTQAFKQWLCDQLKAKPI